MLVMRIGIIAILILLSSCNCECVNTVKSKYKYNVRTSHDNNWTTSGMYYCDSLEFKSMTEAVIYTDGKSMKIFAPMIKVYDLESLK